MQANYWSFQLTVTKRSRNSDTWPPTAKFMLANNTPEETPLWSETTSPYPQAMFRRLQASLALLLSTEHPPAAGTHRCSPRRRLPALFHLKEIHLHALKMLCGRNWSTVSRDGSGDLLCKHPPNPIGHTHRHPVTIQIKKLTSCEKQKPTR